MGLYSGGLIIGRILHLRFGGLFQRERLVFRGLIIGVLRYFMFWIQMPLFSRAYSFFLLSLFI